jgi:Helix-turn-helix domain
MAGGSHDRSIGVGPVLRQAREVRGCSPQEASRDTKLRVDQIRALEAEDFDALPGDVYVRGSLRTYAVYLGVDPDEVLGIYSRNAQDPDPSAPPPKMDKIERTIAARRLRDNSKVIILVAATVLIGLLAFGFLSNGRGSPPAAALPSIAVKPDGTEQQLNVAIDAKRAVSVTVIVDGLSQIFQMKPGETRSFTADKNLTLTLADGASLHIVVDGGDLGVPGRAGSAWTHTWTADGGVSPSPSA